MKIAYVSLMSGLPWGGSEVLWSKTALLAIKEGHKVMVSVYDWNVLHPEIKKLKDAGAIIHLRQRYNPSTNIVIKSWNYFKNRIHYLDNTYKAIIHYSPNHIFISQGDTFDISIHHFQLFMLINKNQIPYSLICHNHEQYSNIPLENVYPRAIEIFILAKNIFFVSKRMQTITERTLCTKLTNAHFTWNPLNLKKIDILPWPENNITQFAMVGSIRGGKGHDTLIECLGSEEWKNREWNLNIYGNGNGLEYIKKLAEFYGLSQRIIFHGYFSNITSIWKNNHLLLIPSSCEGLPISLIEAMISGRPAVVTDVGGNIEVITEDINGFIAEAPSVSSFSKTLEKAWTYKKNWERMGKNAHKYCIKNVDLQPERNLLKKVLSK